MRAVLVGQVVVKKENDFGIPPVGRSGGGT